MCIRDRFLLEDPFDCELVPSEDSSDEEEVVVTSVKCGCEACRGLTNAFSCSGIPIPAASIGGQRVETIQEPEMPDIPKPTKRLLAKTPWPMPRASTSAKKGKGKKGKAPKKCIKKVRALRTSPSSSSSSTPTSIPAYRAGKPEGEPQEARPD
eukprot:15484663-Alexandrium_andersonii.AAC.1